MTTSYPANKQTTNEQQTNKRMNKQTKNDN